MAQGMLFIVLYCLFPFCETLWPRELHSSSMRSSSTLLIAAFKIWTRVVCLAILGERPMWGVIKSQGYKLHGTLRQKRNFYSFFKCKCPVKSPPVTPPAALRVGKGFQAAQLGAKRRKKKKNTSDSAARLCGPVQR